MTKADRVHSTPPLNSSSFPDDRIPPEARSESADSLPQPAALPQPESKNLTGDSPKPPEGFHRVIDANGKLWFKADEYDALDLTQEVRS